MQWCPGIYVPCNIDLSLENDFELTTIYTHTLTLFFPCAHTYALRNLMKIFLTTLSYFNSFLIMTFLLIWEYVKFRSNEIIYIS